MIRVRNGATAVQTRVPVQECVCILQRVKLSKVEGYKQV